MEEDPPFSDEVLSALLVRLVNSTLAELRRQHYPAHGTQLLAKQLEAVAWLYYRHFHRLFPSLDYYDPGEFCKKILILRCGLDNYLDKENGLIEARIKLASRTADFSSGDSKITRVAALLLSRDKTHCLVVKSLITEGQWSLIEAEVKHGEPPLEATLSAVQKVAGFEAFSMEVEKKVYQARCMSQTGDFTGLYVMILKDELECNGSQASWITLDDLLLQIKSDWLKKNWEWEATPAIDYFHIQPFVNALTEISTRSSERSNCVETLNSHNDKMEWSSSDVVHPPSFSPSSTISSSKRKIDEAKEMLQEPKKQRQQFETMIVSDSEDEDDKVEQRPCINQVVQDTQNHCSNSFTAKKYYPPCPITGGLQTTTDEKQDSTAVQETISIVPPTITPTSNSTTVVNPLVFSTPEKCISYSHSSTPATCSLDRSGDEASEVSALLLASKHQQQRLQKLMELRSTFELQTAAFNAESVALHKELVEGEAELQSGIQKLGAKKSCSETSFLAHLPDAVKELEAFAVKSQWLKPTYEFQFQTAPSKSTPYVYTVIVRLSGQGIQLSEKGSSGTNLHAAKQSAAAAMLGRLYLLKSKSLA